MSVSAVVNSRLLDKSMRVFLIPIIAFLISLKLQEVFNVNVFLITVSAAYLLKNILLPESADSKHRHLNELDYALMLIVAVELITYSTSSYKPNSFYSLLEVLFFFLFYMLVRFNLKYEYQRIALYVFISLWGVLLSVVALYYLLALRYTLATLGFSDLTDFRNHIYVLTPVGYSIGEWVTVLFLILPFSIILFVRYRHSALARCATMGALLAVLFTISITFVRGAYVALLVFFVLGTVLFCAYRIFPLKKILVFDAFALGLLMLTLIPWARPMMTTVSFLKTTAQVRSFEGRKSIWRDSLKMIKDHPWVGVGANNFVMQYVNYKDQKSETAFALRPFNYFLQVLTEKGLIGLFAYAFLLFSFYRVSHRKIGLLSGDVYRKSIVLCFMAAYAALVVRDLSESSILTNRGVGVLLSFIFASNARLED